MSDSEALASFFSEFPPIQAAKLFCPDSRRKQGFRVEASAGGQMKKYLLGLLVVYGMYLQTGCGGGSSPQTQQPLAITSSTPPSGTTGTAYAGNGFVLTASGGQGLYHWSWTPASGSALPPGLTLSNGVISGTPTTPNTYNVVIKVADSQSPPAQKSIPYTIKVTAGALVITSSSPPSGTVGATYASGGFSLTASGGAMPYWWSWVAAPGSALPPGLTLTNGVISGTPTASNTYNVVITVADSQNPSVQTPANYTITVSAQSALVIASGHPPAGTVGRDYCSGSMGPCMPGFPLSAAGGVPPYRWSWTGAPGSATPPGLRLVNYQTGSCYSTHWEICGRPTLAGYFHVVVTVSDSASPQNQSSQTYGIQIFPGPLTIATSSVAVGAINLPYSFAFSATGGYPPYSWSQTGALPPGLNLAADGTLSGTPTATGSFPITVSVVDSHSQTATPANFTVQIAANGFKATGSMTIARSSHTATLLKDGRVLVAGGWGTSNGPINSAELYDPLTDSFSIATNMVTPLAFHTATLLSDGRVLLAGGGTTSAELYDPASGNFVAAASMTVDRVAQTATLLNDGRVLVVGGNRSDGTILGSAEIFDPAIGVFTSTGSMHVSRESHTATLLSNGKVLVTGGIGSLSPFQVWDTAELYDPATGLFTYTGKMSSGRGSHSSTALNNGTVVVIGGVDSNGNDVLIAEIYNPATGTFSTKGNLSVSFVAHTATLLVNGQILLAGGWPPVATVGLFDPVAGTFALTGTMTTPRGSHTATLLNDGTVLVVGGVDLTKDLNTAELYQ